MDTIATGTMTDLTNRGVTVNGHKVTNADLSVLFRLGIITRSGFVDKGPGAKGKPAGIYNIPAEGTLSFSVG